MCAHTWGIKMEHWCVIYKWNKFNSFPEVQLSDLLITRDKLCVGICPRVRGSGAVTCNHKTPQMGIHVGGPQRNLPSSLCRIHAIFGASGLLFGRSGQISSTVCTPSGPSTKKPFQTLGWFVSHCSDRVFSTIVKHSSCCLSQVCIINRKRKKTLSPRVSPATPAGARSLPFPLQTHPASATKLIPNKPSRDVSNK